MREIRWSRRAMDDLREIGRYIAADRPASARKLLSRLRKKVTNLSAFPLMGRVVPEFSQEELREVREGNYRIVYQVSDEFIDVVTVFEAHRLFPFEEEDEQ